MSLPIRPLALLIQQVSALPLFLSSRENLYLTNSLKKKNARM